MNRDRNEFLEELIRRTRGLLPAVPAPTPEAAKLVFIREHLIGPWGQIVGVARRELDEQYASLTPDEQRQLRVLQRTPSLLAPLGRIREETTHTRLLAWFLALPDATGHGCRSAWRTMCGLPLEGSTDGWRIRREAGLGAHGRVDLMVVMGSTDVVFVEVKVDHHEGEGQLERYAAALRERAESRRVLVYLTLDGKPGSPEVPHKPLGFRDLILEFLPHAVGDEPSSIYLSMWLASLARDVLHDVSENPMDEWTLQQRRLALNLLRPEEGPRV